MQGELVNVRKLPSYLPLLNACLEIRDTTVRQAEWLRLLARWKLGAEIIRYEREGLIEKEYGNAVVMALSQDIGLHYTVVYRAIAIATKFPTLQSLKDFKHLYEKENEKPLSLTYIRERVLPKPKDEPEKHGGAEALAERQMSLAERLGHELEDLKSLAPQVSGDTREEIAGVIHKLQEVLSEPTFLPTAKVDRDSGYLNYVRTLPCVVCGGRAEPHHVEGGGVALKGSDYLTIPLCRKHHDAYHSEGKVGFQQANHVDVFYETTLCLAGFVKQIQMGREADV